MMASPRLAYIWVLAALCTVVLSSRLLGIPTIPFDIAEDGQTYRFSNIKSVIIDSAHADSVYEYGETLIPQTLNDFASVFKTDLDMAAVYTPDLYNNSLFQTGSFYVAPIPAPDSIFLTVLNTSDFRYASGESSPEGYILQVSALGVTISGASPLGVWWGIRSLLQMITLTTGNLPHGSSLDSPGWKVRGMMLDVGRKYYPPQFITNLCSYMSLFKQNTLQLHLSDNLYNNVKVYSREQSLSLYARFRLWSDAPEVEGLNLYQNESYTGAEFDSIQRQCARRGVTIIPEIEAPGHALPIVQWKPELGLSTDLSLLNISHPDTIPTMKTIWSTFFDWFESKTVHIGADEYTGDVTEYNRFVNEMAEFIREKGKKAVRIWGTFPPKPEYDNNISTDVSIQHWEFFEDNPLFDYIRNNYSVVNSDDTFYVVNKWSGSYPQKVNISKTFHGDPASGGPWRPYIFDTKNSSNNPSGRDGRDSAAILGAITPLWNDYGSNATVVSETYYAWREGIPALADKQWGGTLLTEEFVSIFPVLHNALPNPFLEETVILGTHPIIIRYNSTSWEAAAEGSDMTKIIDQSGNHWDALTNCTSSNATINMTPSCVITTGLPSKSRDYTLKLRLFIDSINKQDATIITGRDSALMLTPNLTLFADGNYYRLNSTLPLREWVDLTLIGRAERTLATVQRVELGSTFGEKIQSGEDEEEFQAILGINGEKFVWAPIAIEAPTHEIVGDGWMGRFGGMLLTSEA